MRLAIVYNPQDPKLAPTAYSWTYRDMLLAVMERFAPVVHVTASCEAAAIEADAILFYDVHSEHEIEIAGLDMHPAVKIEYFNDPHQRTQSGVRRSTGLPFRKLGAAERCERARRRGVTAIVCPYREGFHRFLAPHAGGMELWWHPVAPKDRRSNAAILTDRRPEVLGNGHCWAGEEGFRPYEFRRWAFGREHVTCVPHALDGGAVGGALYQGWLSQWAAALALCDDYVVPKYLEIPLAGCVTICQMHAEYAEMWFVDGESCIAVDRNNFDERVRDFLAHPGQYQMMADLGRQVAKQWTADRFAEWLHKRLTTT